MSPDFKSGFLVPNYGILNLYRQFALLRKHDYSSVPSINIITFTWTHLLCKQHGTYLRLPIIAQIFCQMKLHTKFLIMRINVFGSHFGSV